MGNKRKRFRYNEEHKQFIKDNVVNNQKVLAEMFYKRFGIKVTDKAISSLKKRLGIKSGLAGGCKKFTEEQKQFVKDNVVNSEKRLAELFNERFGTNYTHAAMSNLKTRLGIRSGLVGGQFEKGMTSHNKGKKWDDFMSKESQLRSLQTCFKKGNIPKDHKPVGTECLRGDGHIWVKVAEPNKWREKKKIVYEQAYGEIPKGHKLIFLDGNYQNIVPENLAIVTDGVQCILNKRHLLKDDAELTKSGILIAKLIKARATKMKGKQ